MLENMLWKTLGESVGGHFGGWQIRDFESPFFELLPEPHVLDVDMPQLRRDPFILHNRPDSLEIVAVHPEWGTQVEGNVPEEPHQGVALFRSSLYAQQFCFRG